MGAGEVGAAGPATSGSGDDHPEAITLGLHDAPPAHLVDVMPANVVLDLGWGRLVFGQTFSDPDELADVLRREGPGRRDICMYAREAHVVVARSPHELFIDPSHTYRLRFSDESLDWSPTGITVRPLETRDDADEMNRVYVRCGMVPARVDVIWDNHVNSDAVTYLVAVRDNDGSVVGTVTGIDHERLFDDPEHGTSLWTLAVDPAAGLPGVGEALTRVLAEHYRSQGRAYLDLSVVHDNAAAIALYEKLGFQRVPVLCIKRKNAINEPLFTSSGPETVDDLNPYARIIADEAMRRGIQVEVLDAETGELRLVHGGRSVITRESLSEFTSAVAMSRCDDKRRTRRIVVETGVTVPRGRLATFDDDDRAFLEEVDDVVVKPDARRAGQGHHGRGRRSRRTRGRSRAGPRALPRGADRAARTRRRSSPGRDRRQGRRGGDSQAGGGHRDRPAQRARPDRGRKPAPGSGHRRRVTHPARRRDRSHRGRGRLVLRRRAARGYPTAGAPDREPAPGRHDSRRHCESAARS